MSEKTPNTIEGRKPTHYPLDILFEDEHMLAVQKPASMLVIPDRYDANKPTVFDAVWYYLIHGASPLEPLQTKERPVGEFTPPRLAPGEAVPRLVHRLDQGTSGVLLFAKTKDAQRALNQDLENSRVQKCYWAIVVGVVKRDSFLIDKPLGPLKKKKGLMIVDPAGRPSQTEIKVLEKMRSHSWVEASPKTGRQHQIRVHLASEGHPLAFDPPYRRAPAEAYISKVCERLTLHARSITLSHPVSKKSFTIEAPAPSDFLAALDACRAQ